jgi:hypothetical protein
MAQVASRAAPRGRAERLREMSRHRPGLSGMTWNDHTAAAGTVQ